MAGARHRGRWGVWVVVSLVLHGLALVLAPAPRRPAPLEETEEIRRDPEEPPESGGGQDEQTRRQETPLRVVRLDPSSRPTARAPREEEPDPPAAPERQPEADPEPEPEEPEPEPEPPPDPQPEPEYVQHVLVDRDEEVQPAPEARAIAAFDAVASRAERPPVIDPRPGPSVRALDSRVLGTPSPVRSPVVGRASTGESEPNQPSPRPEKAREVAVAGPDPERATPRARAAPPPPLPRGAPRPAPEPKVSDRPAPTRAPTRVGGERGLVVPVTAVPDRGAPELLGAAPAAPAAPPARAVVDDDRPPAVLLANLAEPLETPPEPTEAVAAARPVDAPAADQPTEGDPDRRPDPESAGDADQTLRTPSTTHQATRARPAGHPAPARPTEPGAESGSPQAAFDDPSMVDAVRVTARADPLGAWMREVDGLAYARWLEAKLPIEDVAFGVGGVVVVEFQVDAHGRVGQVRLAERSGFPQVDAFALRAIPDRVPAPPRGPVPCRIVFRYRNEIATTSR